MIRVLAAIFIMMQSSVSAAQVTYNQTRRASEVIGKWLSKSTGHYDFLSATSVNPKRPGTRFFGIPDMQMASEYGFSYLESPRDKDVTNAYKTVGADTGEMKRSLALPRFHLNLGFANRHDFTFSYLIPLEDQIKGWGVGYKRVLANYRYLFLSYRLNYASSRKDDYFENQALLNDLSFSIYLRLLDIYAGVRHWSGKIAFDSSIPELQVPEVEYFSTASEIEHYVGVILATTMHSRLTVEANSIGRKYSIGAKFSFHFDSLLPSADGWFRDPRYIKQ